MTERTTDREAQREATAGAAAHHAGDGCDEDARQTLTHWLAIQNAAVSRLNGENTDLRADVTRLEGERDALRTALEEMSRAWHKQARHGGSWEDCPALCFGHRAALAKVPGQ